MTNGELIKKLRKERRISQAQLAAGISTPILSLLVGEHRLNRVIGLTMAVFIFGNILSAIAPTFFVLILSRIITALVAGITISIAITFATFITPKAKQAWIVSWVFSGFSIASVFGVPTGTWLSSKVGWRLTFWIIAILSTLVLVAFQLALPHDLKQKKVEHFTNQFKILTDSFGYSINFVTIYLVIYGIASLMSNQTAGRLASKNGFQRIFKFYIVQILALLGISVFFKMPIIDLVLIILLGFTIYLAGATCQLFYMHIAEEKYPQSLVLASTFNPIFSNWWCHLYCHFIGNSLGLNSSHPIIINLKGVIYEKF